MQAAMRCAACSRSAVRRRRFASSALQATTALDGLRQRGLLYEVTSSALENHLETGPRTAYLGVDPSAPSLHVGNLVGLIALMHLQLRGHTAIALIGGATGAIGDPSGRSSERTALSPDVLERNVASITRQVRRLFERALPLASRRASKHGKDLQPGPIVFRNNDEWIGKMSLVDFLSGPGKRARVATMLSRESVKNRMNSSSGISFTEFSYQLLQAYDFYHLNRTEACTIQLGGSDQWGNIQSGIDLIRREQSTGPMADTSSSSTTESVESEGAYGLTFPLLTTASGEKFGKSAGNAVWLDETQTSPFDLYQFMLKTSDADVGRYLKVFSFLSMQEIQDVLHKHASAPEKRDAQRLLAQEVTELVHGSDALGRAQAASAISFGSEPISRFSAQEIVSAFSGTPQHIARRRDEVIGTTLAAVLVETGLASSKSQARKTLAGGGVTLGGVRCTDPTRCLELSDFVEDKVAVLRVGKSALRVVELQ